ncbi:MULTISPECIES: response regulator [unclassified Frigoribacterium]|uniref:response regulator n=1 Tax=unclassified Frigoribacterium TaxID=2627005 RepID=UPI0006F226C5|nr:MULTISPECIES: response regulator [unclassified Frigoribacterium]KQO47990.1 two-component system response regulator [Frigoribacterium sp. Leaf254]KQT40084.1 two-component system response regulator [Frigoribacterium sp. Leaf415]
MTTELTVLVVDDDFYVADLHRRQVEQLPGLRALPAVGTIAEVRRVLAERPVDLLLLDVHLPDGSGLDLLREVDVDAFVLSAASDATTVRRALRRGALGYLIKPFASGTLVDRLRAYQRYRNVLDERTAVDQEALERALRILHSGDAAKAASSSRSATEQAVLEQFGAEAGAGAGAAGGADVGPLELSAADVAARVGVSRATAQRYLAALAADGLVTMKLSYGTTGRPEHRYSRP